MERLELIFVYEKPTKNTIRYKEELGDEDIAIGSLYVQKAALGDPVPQKLKVTIQEDTNSK